MRRLLLLIALGSMSVSATALASAGSWFEFGEVLHALREWAGWLLG